MSLTLIKRPLGHKLNYTDITAEIIDDGTGDALVYTGSAHGLSDGDYVYIESNIDSYNGFKYVDQIAYDSFKIKNSENGDLIEWVQDADISYGVAVLNHGWQSVHLPIVYELQSDLWPNNVAEEAYVPNTIDSFSNSNGYVQLNLDQALTGATVRNWLELVGSNDLAGPYQIIAVTAPWAIVINLAYDAGLSFAGLQVVNYYNNYAVNVEIWAGLSSDHRWASKKPYELAATLKLIPDSEGKAKFSINEVLKGYITTRNNLTLDTLPNNLDFHVAFYIKYYESYDDSDGTEITTFEDTAVTDSFEGHTVNSMMPFKSLNSGFMSEYVNEDSFLARWLTLFDVPIMFVDRFFDISFINQYNSGDVIVTMYKSINNVVTDTEILTITNPGYGIIRVPIMPQVGFDKYCIQAAIGDRIENQIIGANVFNLATFANGPGNAWNLGAEPEYDNSDGSALLYVSYPVANGNSITLNYNVEVDFLSSNFNLIFTLTNSTASVQDTVTIPISSIGLKTGSVVLSATADRALFAVFLSGPGVTKTVRLIELSEGTPVVVPVLIPGFNVTEQICINVIQDCETTFVNDNLRLTEGSQLRELE